MTSWPCYPFYNWIITIMHYHWAVWFIFMIDFSIYRVLRIPLLSWPSHIIGSWIRIMITLNLICNWIIIKHYHWAIWFIFMKHFSIIGLINCTLCREIIIVCFIMKWQKTFCKFTFYNLSIFNFLKIRQTYISVIVCMFMLFKALRTYS